MPLQKFKKGIRRRKRFRSELPEIAAHFLRSEGKKWTRSTQERMSTPLHIFHSWLDENKKDLQELKPSDLARFVSFVREGELSEGSIKVLVSNVCRYLSWLRKIKKIDLRLEEIFPESRACIEPLARSATDFLSFISLTSTRATLRNYENAVRRFHEFLKENGLQLKKLNRRDVERWLRWLADQNYCSRSRVQHLILSRVYLRWLHSHQLLLNDPDEIIQYLDFPKVPEYLPRPLNPDNDQILQTALNLHDDLYSQALLLMRLTGLRKGELLALPRDCLWNDFNKDCYLKVPLGKMKNERLVPLNDQAIKIVQTLQKWSKERFRSETEAPPLLVDKKGKRASYTLLCKRLKEKTSQFDDPMPITPHRLRHTYATELLNAGMSIFSIMKLLGHRHFKMTLRYTAVAQGTIRKQYFEALRSVNTSYDISNSTSRIQSAEFAPENALEEVAKWIQKRSGAKRTRTATLIEKRLRRLKTEIKILQKDPSDSE